MKKKFLLSVVFVLGIGVGGSYQAKAQPAQTPTQKPFMWACFEEGVAEIEKFKSLKLEEMSKKAGLRNSLLNNKVLLGNFWGMIKYFEGEYRDNFSYLHVYFGINSEKKIVLIFGPSTSEMQSSVFKYYYLPKNFNPAEPTNFVLNPGDQKTWTDKFIDAMALNTIGTGHPDNQFPGDDDEEKKPSDTRYMTFCVKDIQELVKVKDYYISKGFDISNSVNGSLGSYSLDGAPRGEVGRYVNRIVLQFDFLDSTGIEVYLDSMPGFKDLRNAGNSKCEEEKKDTNRIKKLDNAHLCPTNCP